jgi:hypothetical protein
MNDLCLLQKGAYLMLTKNKFININKKEPCLVIDDLYYNDGNRYIVLVNNKKLIVNQNDLVNIKA